MMNIIRKMDTSILELALVDAFCDMCFYEGDDFVQDLESYISDVLAGKNTEEQDSAFMEISEPYIVKSIIMYCGESLLESQEEITVGADSASKSVVPADSLKQMKKSSRDLANKKLLLSESEEEIFGQMIIESLQKAIDVSKEKVGKIGKKLADTTTSGIIALRRNFRIF